MNELAAMSRYFKNRFTTLPTPNVMAMRLLDGSTLSGPGSEQQPDPLQYRARDACRNPPDQFSFPGAPVEALDLVGQDGAADAAPFRQDHLEGIPLDPAGDRTGEQQPDLAVV